MPGRDGRNQEGLGAGQDAVGAYTILAANTVKAGGWITRRSRGFN